MSTVFDGDVLIHHVIAPGLPGDGFTAPEAAALRADVTSLLSRPVIDKLTDIPDVVGTPSDGQVPVYSADDDEWHPGEVVGTISAVYDHTDTVVVENATSITAKGGLTARAGTGPGAAVLEANIGTSATTVAAGNHTHSIRPKVPFRYTATGSLSGGTRTLASGNVTGLDPAKTYVISATLSGHLRGEGGGAGYTTPRITINDNTRNIYDRPRTVAGVQVPFHMEHPGVTVTGVSSVAVSAQIVYSEGDPVYVGGGEMNVEVTSNR